LTERIATNCCDMEHLKGSFQRIYQVMSQGDGDDVTIKGREQQQQHLCLGVTKFRRMADAVKKVLKIKNA